VSQDGDIVFREEPAREDLERVRRIIEESGFFHPYEVTVAVELVSERLLKGIESGYFFVFAEVNGEVAGYACYGPVPCTEASYDIYWIAVRNDLRHKGLGKRIQERVEAVIRKMGGRRIYVETSTRDLYAPTRSFYRRVGFYEEAVLADFYARGDGKSIMVKVLEA
jgi:D-alanine-D-alanine ligase